MTRAARFAAWLVFAVVAASPLAAQELELPPGRWWDDPRLAARIGLDKAQQRAIHDLVYEHARRMIDLKADVECAGLDLAEAAKREDFDVAAVREAYRAFRSARGRLEDERFEMLVAVRQVLSAEQWTTLQELRRRVSQERPGRPGPDRRPGAGPSGLR